MSKSAQIRNIELSKLQLNEGQIPGLPKNPRFLKDDRFKALVKSIEDDPEMLELRECIVYPHGQKFVVIAGNMRYRACMQLGYKDIPCKVLPKETPVEKLRAYTIKDNVSFGSEDWDLLANEWEETELKDFGMTDMELKTEVAVEDDYEIPDTIKTKIKLGDLIEIGQHRLLCGDSTNSDHVEKLMGGSLADLVVSDPPYNTGMNGEKMKKTNRGDRVRLDNFFNDSFTPQAWENLKTGVFNNFNIFTKGECAFYIFIDWRRVSEFKEAVESFADVKNIIVWDKGVHGLGSDYKSTYENIVVGKKGKPQINNRIGLDYQDIWRVQRKMGRDEDHATKKPIELLSKPILHASKQDDIVLDLFGGSGSTMIACHQLKRRAYLQEIEPKYCQVIIDRMLNLNPKLKVKINDKLYENVQQTS